MMTTEAIFPEQRVTTIEEWLTKLDRRNGATEGQRVSDMLDEELFRLKSVVVPGLAKQLTKLDPLASANESDGWVGPTAAIMRNLIATDEKKKAVEARCRHLDSKLEEIRLKTSALLDEKRRIAASDKDESGTKESRKLYRATKRAERAEKRLEKQRARTDEALAERAEKERLCRDSKRRWKASEKKLAQWQGRFKETGGQGCIQRSHGPDTTAAAGVTARKPDRG